MAEIVAGPFISFVVERLGDVLIQKGSFLRGISGQVEQMQTELTRMQCILKDAAARREGGDESVRNWIAEIREAAYDAEDVIDTFVVKVAFKRRTGTGILYVLMRYSCVVKDCIAIHKVGVKIESIKTKIANIRTSLENYGIKAISEGESSSSRHENERLLRQSYPHIMEDDIVGLDEDLKMIVEHLVREERQCQVVSIWGMGGLGKTTLAKKVYHHNDVRRHFHSFAWAFISQQCKTREVLEGILVDLTSPSLEERNKIKIMNHGELVAELCRVQSQKKCLVVIDDIWKVEDWKILSPAFPDKKIAGSKILLTSRTEEVTSNADQQHVLKHLNEAESWDLFEKKAILKRNVREFELSTEMMELGKEMVKHCGGLPLAIVVLGGLLATKHKMDEWEMVSRKIKYYLNKHKDHGGLPVSDILSLSYQDLPYHLKACFLYLSHFPEDYDIEAKTLVQMWMAEGIVSSSVPSQVGETMLDVGMSYLGELAQRCMVQIQLSEFTNTIEFCRLHDLMRDLCLSKALEENFLKVGRVEASDHQLKWENSTSSSSSSLTTIRRLAVHYFGDHIAAHNGLEITNHQHLRSCQFYFFGDKLESSGWEQIKSLLKGLKLLRILNLQRSIPIYMENKVLPSEIGNLFHLRYLGIRGSRIESLPSSIGNLTFLQTLDLRTYVKTNIPNVLWRLEQLRHLYLPDRIKLPGTSKLRLDGLSKLETLEDFKTEYCDVRCFPKLTNLQNVRVDWVALGDLAVILKSPILNNSNSLQRSLSFYIRGDFRTEEEQSLLRQLLECHHLHCLCLDGSLNLVKLPDQFPPNLTKLQLNRTKLEEDPMPILEKLPNLRTLYLEEEPYIGKEMVCSAPTTTTTPTTAPSSSSVGGGGYGCDGGFPQLKYLSLVNMKNLEEWRVEEGAMPTLFRLLIGGCPKLKEIPDGLRFITTLRELNVGWERKVLKDRVQEGGEDFYKVQHVPSITIN